MAGGTGWSKNGIGKSRRSRSRASTPSRFFRCCKIHFAGFSEKRPSRVLPTIAEMTVMRLLLAVRRKKGRLIGEQTVVGAGLADQFGACRLRFDEITSSRPFRYKTATWAKLDTGAMVHKNAHI